MDLPQELKQLIASHLDDKSVLNIRLIDKKWFNSINNIHFPIFMPRSETLPLIIDSLSRYNTPISLTIYKPIRIPLRDFIEQVAKLSNITSLTFPHFADFEFQSDQPEWHLLTNLTKLRKITQLDPNRIQKRYQLSAPEGFLRALAHLPHLATLNLTNCYYSSEELDKYMTLFKRLEDLSVQNIPSLDLLPLMSSRLTRLCFLEPPTQIPVDVNEVNVFHNLRVLRLSCLKIRHLSLAKLSSLVTLEAFPRQVTGLDNNTNLRHLTIQSVGPVYDQIRKLSNLERLTMWTKEENKDPYFFNEFTKLTYLCIIMKPSYEIRSISSSVKTLELEIHLNNNYVNLAFLTSLDSLIVTTWDLQTEKSNHLVDVSTLTGLTRLTVESVDDLTLANLSALTNLQRLHTRSGNSRLSLELSFLSHLTNLRALSNTKLKEEHYSEIATLTQLTHLACINEYNEQGDFSLLSHLPLRIFAAEVLQEDLNSFLQTVSVMTTLELLGIFDETQQYNSDTAKHVDWSLLSNLTRLTRLDLGFYATSDTLTSLTRVTSLQYLGVKKPDQEYDDNDDDDDQQESQDIEPTPSLDDWLPFTTQFPNLVSVSYVYSSVYFDPFTLDDLDPK